MRKKYSRRGSIPKASRKERRTRQAEKAGEVPFVLDRSGRYASWPSTARSRKGHAAPRGTEIDLP